MDNYNPVTNADYYEAHIEALKEELKEKDAMIDWLAECCRDFCDDHRDCNDCVQYPLGCPELDNIKNRFEKYIVPDWRNAAQEAVKKNVD